METSIMNDLKTVLKEYDLEVYSIRTESYKGKKGVWWVHTPDGYKILKKQAYADTTLKFIISAMEHLMNNGMHMPKIIKNKTGDKYALLDKTAYIVSEAIDGRTLDYSTDENIKRIVAELGNFHKASVGFKPPQSCKVRTHLGKWPEKYKKEVDKLKGYYDIERNNKNHSAFGEEILREFPYFYKRMIDAMKGFDGEDYHQWVKEVEELGGLCHQDFTAGNLLFTDKDEIYVLDPDSITIDIPLRDIRKILNKIMKRKKKWDLALVKDILKWYQIKNPLKKEQWRVLNPTLTYPHLFAGIMGKYYEKREKTWTEKKYLSRLKEMIQMDKSQEIIIENFDEILPL
ncbi:CotS family spore coat protein [Marinisporobacter balticus]|uniref:CotS family spore coat protein n=1 Tax=Marinisporobacter balticus TaxID=2018667 RepID=UPI001404DFAE|nr:CotS family spore coat protein [Marinisporobacter balticus]